MLGGLYAVFRCWQEPRDKSIAENSAVTIDPTDCAPAARTVNAPNPDGVTSRERAREDRTGGAESAAAQAAPQAPTDALKFEFPPGSEGGAIGNAIRSIVDGHYERIFDDPDIAALLNPSGRILDDQFKTLLIARHKSEIDNLSRLNADVEKERTKAFRRKANAGLSEPMKVLGPSDSNYKPGETRLVAPRPEPGESWSLVQVEGETRFVRLRTGEDPQFAGLVQVQRAAAEEFVRMVRYDVLSLGK